jgi:hypothetical protein
MSTEKPSLAELVKKAEGIATDLPKHREYGEVLEWAVGVVNDREEIQKWLLWTYGGVGCGEVGDLAPPADGRDLHACFCAISAIICDLSPGRNGIKSFPYRDWGRQIRDGLLRDPTHRARAMGAWNEAKSTINSQIAQTGRAQVGKGKFSGDLDRRAREYRPPEPVSCLRDWSKRLEKWISKDQLPDDLVRMIFRPHKEAWSAMMDLSVQYPHIIEQIQSQLEFTEKRYEQLTEGRSAAENLWRAICDLNKRILRAVSTIEDSWLRATEPRSPDMVPGEVQIDNPREILDEEEHMVLDELSESDEPLTISALHRHLRNSGMKERTMRSKLSRLISLGLAYRPTKDGERRGGRKGAVITEKGREFLRRFSAE